MIINSVNLWKPNDMLFNSTSQWTRESMHDVMYRTERVDDVDDYT